MVAIKRLATVDADFKAKMDALLAFEAAADDNIERTVAGILADVKARGDAAVVEYTNKFDRLSAASMADLELGKAELQAALDSLPAERRAALEAAAGRIKAYHERQRMEGWSYTEADGTMLGQMITPLDRVGLYVPGGKAAYPSSVLMNAIPAKVAGVKELIMVVPTPGGEHNQLVLAAACLAGVDRVFTLGGAQAVGALAYGTQAVPQVDKIVGPGNAYVATAKRRVFGIVGIDMVAGPSEILVVSDGSGNPDWVAMDLFSQAEHDELAQSILLCPDLRFIDAVAQTFEKGVVIVEARIHALDGAEHAALLPDRLPLGLDRPRLVGCALLAHRRAILWIRNGAASGAARAQRAARGSRGHRQRAGRSFLRALRVRGPRWPTHEYPLASKCSKHHTRGGVGPTGAVR